MTAETRSADATDVRDAYWYDNGYEFSNGCEDAAESRVQRKGRMVCGGVRNREKIQDSKP